MGENLNSYYAVSRNTKLTISLGFELVGNIVRVWQNQQYIELDASLLKIINETIPKMLES